MALRFSYWQIRGLRQLIVGILAMFSVPAAAQAPLTPGLPLLFDAREHLPLPDLSDYPRLRFLTTTDFPPFNFADQNGRLAGFHIDLVREICAVLEMEARCQIQALPFASIEEALASGQAEAAVAAVAVTPARRERFGFSRPYLLLPARFAVAKKAMKPDAPVPDPGWRLGTVADTAHDAMARVWFPQMKAETFASQEALLEALAAGRVDAAFSDGLRLSFWVAGDASQACCVLAPGAFVSERFLGEGLTVMVQRKDRALAQAFDHALAELAANGRLEEIYLRYFPEGMF